MKKPQASAVSAQKLDSGGWLLSIVHAGRYRSARYFEYTLRDAKARFLADVRAGLV